MGSRGLSNFDLRRLDGCLGFFGGAFDAMSASSVVFPHTTSRKLIGRCVEPAAVRTLMVQQIRTGGDTP